MDFSWSLLRRDSLSHVPSFTIQKRLPDQTSSSSETSTHCVSNGGTDTCEKGANMSSALPIALGVCIPVIAVVVFIILHRQYRKRLRREDKADAEKYKSMDFGMDLAYNPKRNKKDKEKDAQILAPAHMRGLSLDPTSSTFFMPSNNSIKDFRDIETDSIHQDRYHAIGTVSQSQSRSNSPMPPRRVLNMESNSTVSHHRQDPDATLLHNAQTNPTSHPPVGDSVSRPPYFEAGKANSFDVSSAPGRDSYFEKNVANIRGSNNYLQAFLQESETRSWTEEEKPSKMASSSSSSSSSPTSLVHSTGSTIEDSNSSREIKTPLTSFSDTDSIPHMPIKTTEILPVGGSSSEFDFSIQVQGADDHDASTQKPLRFGTPSSSELLEPLSQSVEHKIAATETGSHHSFDASAHMSYVSAGTSNYSDISHTPSELSRQPSLQGPPSMSAIEPKSQDLQPQSYGRILRNQLPGLAVSSSKNLVPNQENGFDFNPKLSTPIAANSSIDELLPGNLDDDDDASHYDPDPDHRMTQRMSVLVRPLPPDDVDENPEERANRIRSFYKEYFDENQAFKARQPLASQPEYHEDYGSEFQDAGTLYDAANHGFVVAAPFAQPVTRRAMTPPPRAPPRFDSRDSNQMDRGHHLQPPRNQSALNQHHNQQHAYHHGRGRAPSSPAQYQQPRGAMSPYSSRGPSALSQYSRDPSATSNGSKIPPRPFAPPKDLKSIPTPSKLKENAAIFEAADFAPPVSYRDRQNGRRPDSPLGNARSYSPAVKAFIPLGNSFDDLQVVPSPHALRDSKTFTSLDFAPPSRLRNVDSGSDASSIRSGGSAMSQRQLHHMRAGAYRLSRIPKGLAGSKQDIMSSLKPTWDLRGPV